MFNNIYRNKKVLVTGHTGFKGSWITTWLIKLGANVVGFRAPFGIYPSELTNILKKYNYKYDSSTIAGWFPGRYNEIKNSKPKTLQNGIIKLPVPNFSQLKIPAGLSYIRLLHPMFRNSFAKDPYMIYLHLHEFNKGRISNKIPQYIRLASSRNRGDKAWKIKCVKTVSM